MWGPPDRTAEKAGVYLLLPPDYQGQVPGGYYTWRLAGGADGVAAMSSQFRQVLPATAAFSVSKPSN